MAPADHLREKAKGLNEFADIVRSAPTRFICCYESVCGRNEAVQHSYKREGRARFENKKYNSTGFPEIDYKKQFAVETEFEDFKE